VKLVYIAGKYRGKTPEAVEQNILVAESLAAAVLAAGIMPVVTHSMTRNMDGVASDAFMLAWTLEIMRRCDAVILVHNWRDSAGSLAEVDEAKRIGIPVFGLAQNGTPDDGALAGLCRWAAEGSA
jgi:hypothetical protein